MNTGTLDSGFLVRGFLRGVCQFMQKQKGDTTKKRTEKKKRERDSDSDLSGEANGLLKKHLGGTFSVRASGKDEPPTE
jgi:hypothetical protein